MLLSWNELNLRIVEKNGGCMVAFIFLEKITSCACLVWSELNDIFFWYAQSCVFNRLLLSVKAEVFTQFTMVDKEVLSAKGLTSEFSPCGISFI